MKVQILESEQATEPSPSQQQSRSLLVKKLSLLGTDRAMQINSPNKEQDLCTKTDQTSDHRHGQLPRERARTRSRSNTYSDLKEQSSTRKSTMCSSNAGLNKLIDEKLRVKERWSLNADNGRQLSCKNCMTRYPVQSPRKRNTNRNLARSKRGRAEQTLGNPQCERRPEDLSRRCVAEAYTSDDSFERDEDKA